MSFKSVLFIALIASGGALAQATSDWTPPPMVPASPPPMPPAEPQPQDPGTPPPPSMMPGPGYVPGQQATPGYQYSPYGQPKSMEKPAPEIGLMVSESLFGMLTAAGVTVLPYFLLFSNGSFLEEPISSIVFCLIFGAAPLAVAQTQVSLANGSRFYQADTWPAALSGVAGMAGVLGIYYAFGWLPKPFVQGGVQQDRTAGVAWLMIGSIAIVPLLQMAVINLFKQPKPGMNFTIGDPVKRQGVTFAPPTLAPIVSSSSGLAGAQLSLLRGNF